MCVYMSSAVNVTHPIFGCDFLFLCVMVFEIDCLCTKYNKKKEEETNHFDEIKLKKRQRKKDIRNTKCSHHK